MYLQFVFGCLCLAAYEAFPASVSASIILQKENALQLGRGIGARQPIRLHPCGNSVGLRSHLFPTRSMPLRVRSTGKTRYPLRFSANPSLCQSDGFSEKPAPRARMMESIMMKKGSERTARRRGHHAKYCRFQEGQNAQTEDGRYKILAQLLMNGISKLNKDRRPKASRGWCPGNCLANVRVSASEWTLMLQVHEACAPENCLLILREGDQYRSWTL